MPKEPPGIADALDQLDPATTDPRLQSFQRVQAYVSELESLFAQFSKVSFSSQPDESVVPQSRAADFIEAATFLERSLSIMRQIHPDLTEEALRVLLHDLHNAFGFILYLDLLLEDGEYPEEPALAASDRAVILSLKAASPRVLSFFGALHSAARGDIPWPVVASTTDFSNLGQGDLGRLECEPNTVFLMIDDDTNVHWLARVQMERTESIGHFISTPEALDTLEGIRPDVILLDYNLGDDMPRGVSLIPRLRRQFPDALIIAHTGDARDSGVRELFEAQGVSVVGKHQWAAISALIRS